MAGGVVFENNACPWSNDMTSTGFTLNIRVTDGGDAGYQWQSSPDGKTGWTDIGGATAAQYRIAAPDSGTWYRCVVTASGSSAASKAVEAVLSSAVGDAHGRIWTNDQMLSRWFLSNGKMAYSCDLAAEGKFHVFGEYEQPGTGKVYMLQTSYGVGGWRMYSTTETAPSMLPYNWFTEQNYHLDECLFQFRDEHPYRVYIGPNMEAGYHSLCVWTDTQLGSKALLGQYSDYAALQAVLRKDLSPLQISLVATESLDTATDDTASIAVNLEEIDASSNFRFCLGRYRDANAFAFNQKTTVTRGYTTETVASNGRTFDNVVTAVENVDSGMSLSWMDQSDSESIWFSIGAGSVRDAEVITDPSEDPPPGLPRGRRCRRRWTPPPPTAR